jgi:hypothetical protein
MVVAEAGWLAETRALAGAHNRNEAAIEQKQRIRHKVT